MNMVFCTKRDTTLDAFDKVLSLFGDCSFDMPGDTKTCTREILYIPGESEKTWGVCQFLLMQFNLQIRFFKVHCIEEKLT